MLSALLVAALVRGAPERDGVTILADPTMPVVATVWYHVGSANKPRAAADWRTCSSTSFGATATHERGDYDRFVTSVGGEDNAYTRPTDDLRLRGPPGGRRDPAPQKPIACEASR
jgi:hypothetical protein